MQKKYFMISESGDKQEKALNNDKQIKNISRQNKEKRKPSKKEKQILQGSYSSLYSTSDQ